jgi:oleate hydratase
MKAHLVGSGLASLAAAAYLIKDGGVLANNVHIYEASPQLGGAMGMAGGPSTGYVLPTGRVFEKEYRCALEFFSFVPSVSNPEKSIKDEIEEFTKHLSSYDKAHIVDRQGNIVKSAHFGLSAATGWTFSACAYSEDFLDDKRIDEFFSADFFETEFWFIWAPVMGSLQQHSAMEMRRFMYRFLHLLPDLSEMTMIYRTRYNQHEAIAKPVTEWLRRQGVNFQTETVVRCRNCRRSTKLRRMRLSTFTMARLQASKSAPKM